MIQKIFVACSSQQRLQILQALFTDLPELARNKQGTHTLQILVSKLQEPEELQVLCMSLSENFFFLANHQHATFLIQKLIDICPIAICQAFYYHVSANLLAYALDRNAMCVLKHMFNKIELEER